MTYLKNCILLPSFIATTLTSELIEGYFKDLPLAARLSADILSDNVAFNPKIPFSHNNLLFANQKLINSNELNKVTLTPILNTLEYIDFKCALIFFVELRETFTYEYLISCLKDEQNTVFLERLNNFLSVLTPEFLCIDNPTSLL